jgi:hypothetical protein
LIRVDQLKTTALRGYRNTRLKSLLEGDFRWYTAGKIKPFGPSFGTGSTPDPQTKANTGVSGQNENHMEFHPQKELEQGSAGQRDDLYQRYLEDVRASSDSPADSDTALPSHSRVKRAGTALLMKREIVRSCLAGNSVYW